MAKEAPITIDYESVPQTRRHGMLACMVGGVVGGSAAFACNQLSCGLLLCTPVLSALLGHFCARAAAGRVVLAAMMGELVAFTTYFGLVELLQPPVFRDAPEAFAFFASAAVLLAIFLVPGLIAGLLVWEGRRSVERRHEY